jgi:polyhydroxybutyrate depolymerase
MTGDCERALPTAVLQFHGTDDPIVPLEGGEGTSGSGIVFPPVSETMDTWRDINQCKDGEPQTTRHGDTECSVWNCLVPTELCLVEGWPHLWPGGARSQGTDADATGAAWAFFDSAVPELDPSSPVEP